MPDLKPTPRYPSCYARASGNCQRAPAWEGNWTWDCFLAFAWRGEGRERLLVTVNFASNQSQCYLRLPYPDVGHRRWRLQDLIGDAVYYREGNELQSHGFYLDMAPWEASVFSLTDAAEQPPELRHNRVRISDLMTS